jgi:hypothetical protein
MRVGPNTELLGGGGMVLERLPLLVDPKCESNSLKNFVDGLVCSYALCLICGVRFWPTARGTRTSWLEIAIDQASTQSHGTLDRFGRALYELF